jgi:hypothetical protein
MDGVRHACPLSPGVPWVVVGSDIDGPGVAPLVEDPAAPAGKGADFTARRVSQGLTAMEPAP